MMESAQSAGLDCDAVRKAFPVLQEVVYLNVGTYGPMPEPAIEVLVTAVREFERMGVASRGDFGAKVLAVRRRIATQIGAAAEEIAFTGNATDAINLVLAGSPWTAGDEIITTTEEHEAMLHPLWFLQRRRGVRVRRVEVGPDPTVMLDLSWLVYYEGTSRWW